MTEKEFYKRIEMCKEMLEVQGRDGTFNHSPYDHGLYNGIEFALSLMEQREPNFRSAPKKWLHEGKVKTFLRKIFDRPKYILVENGGDLKK